jgi:hypothetical protein
MVTLRLRRVRIPKRVPHAGVLAALATVAVIASSPSWGAPAARHPSAAQLRDEAPIGARQPRVQDLPPNVVRDENRLSGGDAFDRKLAHSVCREC